MDNTLENSYRKEIENIIHEFTQLTSLPVEKSPSGGYWLDCYSIENSIRTAKLSAEFLASAAEPIKTLAERSDDLAKTVALEAALKPKGGKTEMLKVQIEALTALGSIAGFCQWAGDRLRKEGPQPE